MIDDCLMIAVIDCIRNHEYSEGRRRISLRYDGDRIFPGIETYLYQIMRVIMYERFHTGTIHPLSSSYDVRPGCHNLLNPTMGNDLGPQDGKVVSTNFLFL